MNSLPLCSYAITEIKTDSEFEGLAFAFICHFLKATAPKWVIQRGEVCCTTYFNHDILPFLSGGYKNSKGYLSNTYM